MARKQYEQFCLRFSLDNPEHVKLFRILNHLDPDIYRSKNQFVLEAMEAYVSGKSVDDFCEKDKTEEKETLTRQDLLEFGEQIREEIKKELYQEIIVHMADNMMAAVMRQPAVTSSRERETVLREPPSREEKEQEVSEEMMENVMKWA